LLNHAERTVSARLAHFKGGIPALAGGGETRFDEGIIRTYILDKSGIIPILADIEQKLNWRARNPSFVEFVSAL
jgi:hypothetical protein